MQAFSTPTSARPPMPAGACLPLQLLSQPVSVVPVMVVAMAQVMVPPGPRRR